MSTAMERIQDEIGERFGDAGPSTGEQVLWKAMTLGSGVLAALVARRVVGAIWTRIKGADEPTDPADRNTSWTNAIQWAVASGVGAGVARVLAQRAAARAWESATGATPPAGGAESALER
ncbi:DUF4235 domain-containing protein [Actinomarinicola tropica]|uniref:DUF4235 domain-containing protein n=1 Tax=Actinomarinicola tropica TaxID=2789776 RepID=A0A5Q2RLR1_9ACTN|nr:DUF4235 domain-containing protein [Actinomarinicola tropica]QGG95017.1 DUF4235 domain-containing protein [Actinomarinicola tropica]